MIEHITGQQHPERPARISAIRDMLSVSGLPVNVAAPTPAPEAVLLLAHSEALVETLRATRTRDGTRLDADTVASRKSFDAALVSVGGALAGVRAVVEGAPGALVLARPPGHHAEADQAMGFCLVNNIAIAARWAQREGLARRVAIIDWDVHHGNGTQHIFWNDPSVLYVSLHQWPFYPGTGAEDEVGDGTTLNIPLPAGQTDAVYRAAFEQLVLPKLRGFAPDLILVSAGYDAHKDDPLAGMNLTRAAYGDMTQLLVDLTRDLRVPRPVLLLEGGYSLHGLAEGVQASLERLLTSENIGEVHGDFSALRRLHQIG